MKESANVLSLILFELWVFGQLKLGFSSVSSLLVDFWGVG